MDVLGVLAAVVVLHARLLGGLAAGEGAILSAAGLGHRVDQAGDDAEEADA